MYIMFIKMLDGTELYSDFAVMNTAIAVLEATFCNRKHCKFK